MLAGFEYIKSTFKSLSSSLNSSRSDCLTSSSTLSSFESIVLRQIFPIGGRTCLYVCFGIAEFVSASISPAQFCRYLKDCELRAEKDLKILIECRFAAEPAAVIGSDSLFLSALCKLELSAAKSNSV